jgi:5-methylthioadenosine/S-adenosylhomocysteine deaminase
MKKGRPKMQGKGKQEPDVLIEGGVLLSMVEGEPPIRNAAVSIKGGFVERIGEKGDFWGPPYDYTDRIDATHGIILPGLVNAHAHTAMTLFRGYADDLPLKTWLFEKIFPLEARHINRETVYWASLLGCLEMIGCGTTSFIDGYFFQDETVRAVHEAGLRALIAQGVIDFPAPGVPDPEEGIQIARAFIRKWNGFSELISPGVFCHSPVTCSRKTLEKAFETSLEGAAPLQIHLSETREEVAAIQKKTGMRPVPYLDEVGILNSRLLGAHAVHLDDEEVALLAERKVRIAHVPESNMKLASGIAPVRKMKDAGLSMGIGTDGSASNNNLDLFQEMDAAAKLGKVFAMDPVSLKAREVLHMATVGGAFLLGREDEIGTLEEGKRADVIVVDLDAPHLQPLYDPYSALVYSADGGDVKDVIVNGRVLMKDRRFITLDPEEILAKVKEITKGFGGGTL